MYRSLFVFLLLVAVASGFAQSVKVDKYKLSNGMTVILHEDHSQPVAVVNIWYKVGSKDEPDRRSGFAHLFEHLMFMGTKRVPDSQFDVLMELHGGSNNATTAEDRTNYYSTGPSQLLPTLLWLEADRMESLAAEMTQKKLDLQREVVKNERRQSVENAPYGKAFEAIPSLMFPRFHPYSTGVIGSIEDLNNAALQDVKDFFNTFYVPNNASMVVAGDFDSKAIKPLIAKLFSTLPRGNDIVRRAVPPLTLGGVKRTTMVDDVQNAMTIMVWHSPPAYKPGDLEMRLAGGILSGGFTSRLYQALVVKSQLANDVSAYQSPLLLGSTFTISATAREGVPLDKVEQAIDAEITKFSKEGPSKAELQRQQSQLTFHSFNSFQSVLDRADRLNEYEFYLGNPNSFSRELDLYRAITPAKVRAVAAKSLDLSRRLILRVVPKAPAPEKNPRDEQPRVGQAEAIGFPKPVEFTLANGMKTYYWQKVELPLTTITFRFKRGAAHDGSVRAGLMELTADMLDESAGRMNADQFAEALDQLGAQLSTGADYQGTSVTLTSLTDKLEPALSLASDALIRPGLKPGDWSRVKSLHLEGLKAEDDDPATVASKVASREYFGSSHPYSRPVAGTVATVASISLNDVKNAYGSIAPANGTIYASGNLPVAAFRAVLDRHIGGWSKKASAVPGIKYPEVPSVQRLVVVDRPGAVQSVIRIMMPTVSFDSPDRYALTELGLIFGGVFTSRINRNLREDKGYTYGAGLRYAFSKPLSYVVSSTSVRSDVTGAALKEIMAEFDKIKMGDVTESETSTARNSLRSGFVDSTSTRQGIVSSAIAYRENGIEVAGIGRELDRFFAVDQSKLNQVAKTGFPFDRAIIVIVGDQAEVLKQIAGLPLPKPEVVKG